MPKSKKKKPLEAVSESASLGSMIAKVKANQIKKDWNAKSHTEKLSTLKKDREDLEKRKTSMKEETKHTVNVTVSDPNHTMVSKRKETTQRRATVTAKDKDSAINAAISHYKRKGYKVHDHVYVGLKEEVDQVDEGIVDTILKSKTMNKANYSMAARELEKRMKQDPKKSRLSHAADVAKYHHNVDARKLAAEEIDMTGCPLLEKLNPSMGIGKYINDFSKSDAPQFKGTSSSKRRQMAVAAYLGAKRKKLERGD